MRPTVDQVCDALGRSRLLGPDEVRALRAAWEAEADAPADVSRFTRWLVGRRFVSEYQAALLVHGHVDHFFVGPYKILDRIGKGRLAVVYKAAHRLGEVVALKVLPPSKARDPELMGRFQRESRLALQLNHPHVVRAFEAGEVNGLHYLVMEYLEGQTLAELFRRRGRLPVAEAVSLVYQALLGLQHLHECGLVHRNLEPANLMAMPVAGGGPELAAVKVLDISLGRSLIDEGFGDPAALRLTYDRALLGEAAYMAPEQARDPHAADIRGDIYSLGCVLYHALAGQPPFADGSPLGQAIRHATETPRPIVELNPEVPEGLHHILGWMTAKSPAERYPTPERAAQALLTFLTSGVDVEPIATPPPPAVEAPAAPAVPPVLFPPAWDFTVVATPPEEPVPEPDSLDWPPPAPRQPPRPPVRRETASQAARANRRAYLALVMGAAGLLAAQTLGWFLGRWFYH